MASFFILKLDLIVVKGKKLKTVYDLQRYKRGNYELFFLLSWIRGVIKISGGSRVSQNKL